MLNSADAISALLQGTVLDGQPIRRMDVRASQQWAFVIEVEQAIALDAWNMMRSLLDQTQRYPVLTESWGDDDYFSRFYYEEEQQAGMIPDVSPEAITASISTADVQKFLEACKTEGSEDLGDVLELVLELTKEQFGSAPDAAHIQSLLNQYVIQSRYDLEKWLFHWELQNFGLERAIAQTDTRHLDWYTPDRQTIPLLLLPTQESWNALAYLHWFGACTVGTPVAMRFLRQWHQKYGAELVCHYGTMLQLKVQSRPSTPEEAFELAWQQESLAPCTTILPGVSLREHARALLMVDRWFLHERP